MDDINNAMRDLTPEESIQLDEIMLTLSDDMKDVKMKSILMAHEAENAAACAFLNC